MIATAVYKEGNDKNLMNKYPYRKTVEKAIIMFYLHENQSLKWRLGWTGDAHEISARVSIYARDSRNRKRVNLLPRVQICFDLRRKPQNL